MLNNHFVPSNHSPMHAGLLVATDEELDAVEGGQPTAEGVAVGTAIAVAGAIIIGGPFGLCFAAGALCGIFA